MSIKKIALKSMLLAAGLFVAVRAGKDLLGELKGSTKS